MDFQRLENFRYLKKAKEICERQIREAIRSLGELTGVNLGVLRQAETGSAYRKEPLNALNVCAVCMSTGLSGTKRS